MKPPLRSVRNIDRSVGVLEFVLKGMLDGTGKDDLPLFSELLPIGVSPDANKTLVIRRRGLPNGLIALNKPIASFSIILVSSFNPSSEFSRCFWLSQFFKFITLGLVWDEVASECFNGLSLQICFGQVSVKFGKEHKTNLRFEQRKWRCPT